eukprot:c11718_g2_i1.p1 GENE.c11718_g2_i1~~c11718_g2_i1.p1  ORF type:complete len:614 (-),score=175.42 c11718_g2_i1:187-2028(-)
MGQQRSDTSASGSIAVQVDSTKSLSELRYESPFAKRAGKDLTWTNLTYEVKTKKGAKTILKDTWGTVPGGKLGCILGPSGAGKSSLLNVLAGRVVPTRSNQISGTVSINGAPINPLRYRSNIAYVMQDDALFATLTPREALRFSAALRIPKEVSREQKESLVSTMLTELGLAKCADTIIGNLLIKGISGGERKRTSVGVELVTNPSVVFLDEPTSGLDSFSALQCVELLRKVASAGSSVLCTIHQPSSDVFQLFDFCTLLKDGHIVYTGPVSDIGNYFAQRGTPVPHMFNPADHIISVVQKSNVEQLRQQNLIADSNQHIRQETDKTLSSFATDSKAEISTSSSIWTQMSWLIWRESIDIRRNIGALVGRYVVTITLSLILGLIFKGAAERDDTNRENFSSHFGLVTMVSIFAMFGTAQPVLLQFPFERPIFLREYATGTYSSVAYFVSKVFSELPQAFMQNLVAFLIYYWLVGFQGRFMVLVAIGWALGCASTSVSMFLGSATSDVTSATELSPMLFVPQILFSGFFVRIQLIPPFMRWAQYLCSLKYAMNLFMIEEFRDCRGPQAVCDSLLSDNDVSEAHTWFYALVLVALFLGFRVISLVLLRARARNFY